MRSAAARRFAFLAAFVLLVPLWARPSPGVAPAPMPAAAVGAAGSARAGATADSTPPSAVRGAGVVGAVVYGTRTDRGRGPVVMAVIALLFLAGALPWSRLRPTRRPPSALARRRSAIALRAPLCLPAPDTVAATRRPPSHPSTVSAGGRPCPHRGIVEGVWQNLMRALEPAAMEGDTGWPLRSSRCSWSWSAAR